jgi:hypothetical protein
MGIDGIGKGRPAAPAQPKEVTDQPRAGETGRAFEVQKPASTQGAASVEATPPSTPLERLRAGQVDMNGYLDLKVQEATAHLEGLNPVELDAVRKMLRDQLATDPALSDLVRQATGHVPSVPSDE